MSGSTGRVRLTELIRYVEVHLPKAPRALIIQCINDTAREFLKETQAYTCLLDAENIRAGITDYEFCRPNRMTNVDRFTKVFFDTDEIQPGTAVTPTTTNASLFPTHGYARISELEIKLLFEPSIDILGGLVAEAVLIPIRDPPEGTRDEFTIPCDVFDAHYVGMSSGVIAKMKAMRGHAWSDRAGAQHYFVLYNKGKQEARDDQNKFGLNKRVVTIAPRVFAGRSRRRLGRRIL